MIAPRFWLLVGLVFFAASVGQCIVETTFWHFFWMFWNIFMVAWAWAEIASEECGCEEDTDGDQT